jgi:RNA polymerase sigma factor (TIGR02999 family)
MATATQDFSRLPEEWRSAGARASARRIALINADLQRLAHAQREQSGPSPTLNTTSLVHQCYLRIAGPASCHVESRHHFFTSADRVLRRGLCDYATQRLAGKRGGAVQVTESRIDAEREAEADALIQLDDLLRGLQKEQACAARVFECRNFAGLGEQETTEALTISLRTAQREGNLARSWLAERLAG